MKTETQIKRAFDQHNFILSPSLSTLFNSLPHPLLSLPSLSNSSARHRHYSVTSFTMVVRHNDDNCIVALAFVNSGPGQRSLVVFSLLVIF